MSSKHERKINKDDKNDRHSDHRRERKFDKQEDRWKSKRDRECRDDYKRDRSTDLSKNKEYRNDYKTDKSSNYKQSRDKDYFQKEKDNNLKEKEDTWTPFFKKSYDPLKAGSIDCTDTEPHDKAIARALNSHFEPPHELKSKPERTLIVSRFGPDITKQDLKDFFSKYGEVVSAKVILDIVTGHPMGYGFVEMRTEEEAWFIARRISDLILHGYKIFVDLEIGRVMKGWKPRRLGGGLGGKKESGQLRFGGKDRPFKRPIIMDIKNNY